LGKIIFFVEQFPQAEFRYWTKMWVGKIEAIEEQFPQAKTPKREKFLYLI